MPIRAKLTYVCTYIHVALNRKFNAVNRYVAIRVNDKVFRSQIFVIGMSFTYVLSSHIGDSFSPPWGPTLYLGPGG
jgi:hypothetical protein